LTNQMIRLYLLFNKGILKINIIFSFAFALFVSPMFIKEYTTSTMISGVIKSFLFSVMTGGFLLAWFFFEISRKNEYYFYYNLGISKLKLLLMSYLLHFIFISPLIFISIYV